MTGGFSSVSRTVCNVDELHRVGLNVVKVFRELIPRKIRVALTTDSCPSRVELKLLIATCRNSPSNGYIQGRLSGISKGVR